MDLTLSSLSSADGHLGCFYLSAVVNNTAVYVSVQISLTMLSVLGTNIQQWIGGSYCNSVFNFFEELPCSFPEWLHRFRILTTVDKDSNFSTSLLLLTFC